MGQGNSREAREAEHRLRQINWLVGVGTTEAERLLPLAEAEKAANIPPTPGSSQAAHKVAIDYCVALFEERHCIWRRQGGWYGLGA